MAPLNLNNKLVTGKGRYSRPKPRITRPRIEPKHQTGVKAQFKALLKLFRSKTGNESLSAFKASEYFEERFQPHYLNQLRFETHLALKYPPNTRLTNQSIQTLNNQTSIEEYDPEKFQLLDKPTVTVTPTKQSEPAQQLENLQLLSKIKSLEIEISQYEIDLLHNQNQVKIEKELRLKAEKELRDRVDAGRRREKVRRAMEQTRQIKTHEQERKFKILSKKYAEIKKRAVNGEALKEEVTQYKGLLQLEKLKTQDLTAKLHQLESTRHQNPWAVQELRRELDQCKQNLGNQQRKNDSLISQINGLKRKVEHQESELNEKKSWIHRKLQVVLPPLPTPLTRSFGTQSELPISSETGVQTDSPTEPKEETKAKLNSSRQKNQRFQKRIKILKAQVKLATDQIKRQKKEAVFLEEALRSKNHLEITQTRETVAWPDTQEEVEKIHSILNEELITTDPTIYNEIKDEAEQLNTVKTTPYDQQAPTTLESRLSKEIRSYPGPHKKKDTTPTTLNLNDSQNQTCKENPPEPLVVTLDSTEPQQRLDDLQSRKTVMFVNLD